MKLWDRIQSGMEAGFDATIAAVHTITEKAGEGIELANNLSGLRQSRHPVVFDNPTY